MISRPRATSARCAIKKSVRGKRTPTQRHESVWSLAGYSVENFYLVQRPGGCGDGCRQDSGKAHLVVARSTCDEAIQAFLAALDCFVADAPRNDRQPTNQKTRPGGQPGGSSYMGAGVDGRSRRIQPCWGGITAPTCIGRSKRGDVQSAANFF